MAVSNLKTNDPSLPSTHPSQFQGTDYRSRSGLPAGLEEVGDSLQPDVNGSHAPSPIPGRHIEEGILMIPEKLYFTLRFEGFPMWILALDRTLVMEVNFLDWAGPRELASAMSAQGHNVSLLNAAIAHIGLSKVHFGKPSRESSVLLVSGSRDFLRSYPGDSETPTVLLLAEHYSHKRVIQEGPFKWTRLRHSLFGGSTLFTALVGTNIPGFEPIKTPLRRNLGHVLDHTVRPKPSTEPSGETLTMADRLHPDLKDIEVTFQTSFIASGWGRRNLTLDEIGVAFGFPSWLRLCASSLDVFPVVPIQILDGCLRALPQATTRHVAIVPPLPPALVEASDSTWLPAVERFLPHTWVDASLVTDKAVKHDNADAPTHLWDARCALVCPGSEALLPVLRRGLHAWASRRMLREF
jgi:hypothetical protein